MRLNESDIKGYKINFFQKNSVKIKNRFDLIIGTLKILFFSFHYFLICKIFVQKNCILRNEKKKIVINIDDDWSKLKTNFDLKVYNRRRRTTILHRDEVNTC